MIKPSTILFIDSSNFYHSLKWQKDLPFDADQYYALIKELGNYFDVKEVRFYDAIKDRTQDPLGYAGQQRFHARLNNKISNLKIRHRKLRYVQSISQQKSNDAAKAVGLASSLQTKLYLFLKHLGVIKLTREKGLDVLIVVDVLEAHKNKKADCFILLSGDSDFVPAVEFMQTEGAKIINLHTYTGSSNELRQVCFEHILITLDISGNVSLKRERKQKK